jgi:hypothetical protein
MSAMEKPGKQGFAECIGDGMGRVWRGSVPAMAVESISVVAKMRLIHSIPRYIAKFWNMQRLRGKMPRSPICDADIMPSWTASALAMRTLFQYQGCAIC